ncbi:hypothetical protein [Henriciella pelagia]|uniref:hypothetical protein n=1 Tax=Henriciella pelagia TaxID=1977912 RepID=UPI00117A6E45|nr:hypothetical protein [Henriciella pelagia]
MKRRLFHILGMFALLAYFANGAQAHLRIVPGETIAVPLCGDGLHRTIEIRVGGGQEDTSHTTCCGDCTVPFAISANPPALPQRSRMRHVQSSPGRADAAHPRLPLWPGAPPHGPPLS